MENGDALVKAGCRAVHDRINQRVMTSPTDREKRLAEALRQNLRRRKEQAREQEAPRQDDDTPVVD